MVNVIKRILLIVSCLNNIVMTLFCLALPILLAGTSIKGFIFTIEQILSGNSTMSGQLLALFGETLLIAIVPFIIAAIPVLLYDGVGVLSFATSFKQNTSIVSNIAGIVFSSLGVIIYVPFLLLDVVFFLIFFMLSFLIHPAAMFIPMVPGLFILLGIFVNAIIFVLSIGNMYENRNIRVEDDEYDIVFDDYY